MLEDTRHSGTPACSLGKADFRFSPGGDSGIVCILSAPSFSLRHTGSLVVACGI